MRRIFSRILSTIAAGILLVGCQSELRGASLREPSSVPKGKLIATYERTACTDGRDLSEPLFVDYVQGEDGVPFVVERSRSSTWLVVTNSFVESGEIVFQSLRANRGKALREYRFPWDGRSAGTFYLSMRYAEPRGTRDRFRVGGSRPHVTCALRRVDPRSGVAVEEGQSSGEGLAALPGPAASTQGWGYDGESFGPGDQVLVQVGGRAVRGQVREAKDGRYLVRMEGAAGGEGDWVRPESIIGRLR